MYTKTSETNGLINPTAYHANVTERITRTVCWTTPGLRIARLRLLGERFANQLDVSYCHGFIGDEPVNVDLPFHALPRHAYKTQIVEHAKRDRINAKRIGVFDALSVLF